MEALRRWAGTPGAPIVAAAGLATAALLEVVLRTPSQPQVPLLLAVLGTAPVAFARRAPFTAVLVVIGATLLIASRRRSHPPASPHQTGS